MGGFTETRHLVRVGLLYNPDTSAAASFYFPSIRNAAASLGLESVDIAVRASSDFDTGLSALGRDPGGGLIVMPDLFNGMHQKLIISLAAQHHLPAVYAFPFYPASGGLISYGIDIRDLYRRAALYVDMLLRGARPADLPVELPTKFELVINLKAAKAIGLEISSTLLARADQIIE